MAAAQPNIDDILAKADQMFPPPQTGSSQGGQGDISAILARADEMFPPPRASGRDLLSTDTKSKVANSLSPYNLVNVGVLGGQIPQESIQAANIATGKLLTDVPRGLGQLFNSANVSAAKGRIAELERQYGASPAAPVQDELERLYATVDAAEAYQARTGAAQAQANKEMEPLEKDFPVATFVGEAAPAALATMALPALGAETLAGRVALGAAGGAGYGATIPTEAEALAGAKSERQWNIATGAALGAAAPAVLAGVQSAVRPIIRRMAGGKPIRIFNENGTLTEETISLLEKAGESPQSLNSKVVSQLQADGVFTPEQAQRFNLFKEAGMPATKANITQTADDYAFQQEATKTSGAVRTVVEQQNDLLVDMTKRRAEATGGQATSRQDAGQSLLDAVYKRSDDSDQAVSDLYTVAHDRAGGKPAVAFFELSKFLRGELPTTEARGNIAGGIYKLLQEQKLVPTAGQGTSGLGATAASRAPLTTVKRAEKIRQKLNQIAREQPKYSGFIADMKDALDEDVFKAAGNDLYAQARDAKASLESIKRLEKIGKYDQANKSLVLDILNGKVKSDYAVQQIVFNRSADSRQLKLLKDFLLDGTPEQKEVGAAAWNNMRQQAIETVLEQTTRSLKTTETMTPIFNPHQFATEFKKIGKEKMKVLFTEDEIKAIDKIQKLSSFRIPKTGTETGKGPSAQAINEVKKKFWLIGDWLERRAEDRAQRKFIKPEQKTIEALREAFEQTDRQPAITNTSAGGA